MFAPFFNHFLVIECWCGLISMFHTIVGNNMLTNCSRCLTKPLHFGCPTLYNLLTAQAVETLLHSVAVSLTIKIFHFSRFWSLIITKCVPVNPYSIGLKIIFKIPFVLWAIRMCLRCTFTEMFATIYHILRISPYIMHVRACIA